MVINFGEHHTVLQWHVTMWHIHVCQQPHRCPHDGGSPYCGTGRWSTMCLRPSWWGTILCDRPVRHHVETPIIAGADTVGGFRLCTHAVGIVSHAPYDCDHHGIGPHSETESCYTMRLMAVDHTVHCMIQTHTTVTHCMQCACYFIWLWP
jgi:hypothetical protein